MEVDFGVEVSRAFADEGEIVLTHTPAGQAASTVHVGRPDQLAGANAAIEEWCRANDRSLAGVSWEIYGDPGEDPVDARGAGVLPPRLSRTKERA